MPSSPCHEAGGGDGGGELRCRPGERCYEWRFNMRCLAADAIGRTSRSCVERSAARHTLRL